MMQSVQHQSLASHMSPCGTPNKESRFPSTFPASRSIKIAPPKPNAYQMQLQNYEALADYRDYVMSQRMAAKRNAANVSASSACANAFGLPSDDLRSLVASKHVNFGTSRADENQLFDHDHYPEEGIFELDL